MDDAPSWAGQGWKDPCLNSSLKRLNPGQSAQNSQGTFPMVGAASPEDSKSLPLSLQEQCRCELMCQITSEAAGHQQGTIYLLYL